MIDIHTHIIPKIDDGSSSFEESYQMLEQAVKMGFSDVIATSHYIEGYYETDLQKRQTIIEQMNKAIRKKGLLVTIHLRK